MYKQFAVSLFTWKTTSAGSGSKTELYHTVGIVECTNKYEAVGMGIERIQNLCPKSEGWRDYDVVAMEIPEPAEIRRESGN